MSYSKAMKHTGRKSRKQSTMHFGFTTLAKNERRESPQLGGAWFEAGMDEERNAFIAQWKTETQQMLAANPSLRIVK